LILKGIFVLESKLIPGEKREDIKMLIGPQSGDRTAIKYLVRRAILDCVKVVF